MKYFYPQHKKVASWYKGSTNGYCFASGYVQHTVAITATTYFALEMHFLKYLRHHVWIEWGWTTLSYLSPWISNGDCQDLREWDLGESPVNFTWSSCNMISYGSKLENWSYYCNAPVLPVLWTIQIQLGEIRIATQKLNIFLKVLSSIFAWELEFVSFNSFLMQDSPKNKIVAI